MLAPSQLRSTQLAILVSIAVGEPPSLARLARELVMDSSTLARNLKPLEQRGLIAKTAVGDRRRRAVVLTDGGRDLVARAVPLWIEAQERFVEQIGRERWPEMLRDLNDAVTAARGLG
jgi:DNA-binding MarR family transcriptional regulator